MSLWAHVANRGTNTAKAAGSTLTISPNADVAAGAVLVLFVAWDNNNNLTATGPLGQSGDVAGQFICYDNSGQSNAWATVFEAQDNGQTARCHAAIFVCQLRGPITTGDTITVTHVVSGSWVAKACVLEEFSLPSGYGWANYDPRHVHTRAADPASISTAGAMPSREWLLLHVLAAEGPSTDSYTWDSDYTVLTNAGTTGGVDDSNMTVNPSYRIATLSGDTVDVTSDTADRDYTQGLVGLTPHLIGDPFPSNDPNQTLDDFNRADDAAPIDSPWANCYGSFVVGTLSISSNQAAPAGDSLARGQFYASTQNDGLGSHEAWATAATIASGDQNFTGVAINGPEGTLGHGCADPNGDAYYAMYRIAASNLQPHVWYGNGGISLGGPVGYIWCGTMSNGWKIGIRRGDSVSAIWWDRGSGWEYSGVGFVNTSWTTGRPGLVIRGSSMRMDDFGFGQYVPIPPQVYRTVYAEVV